MIIKLVYFGSKPPNRVWQWKVKVYVGIPYERGWTQCMLCKKSKVFSGSNPFFWGSGFNSIFRHGSNTILRTKRWNSRVAKELNYIVVFVCEKSLGCRDHLVRLGREVVSKVLFDSIASSNGNGRWRSWSYVSKIRLGFLFAVFVYQRAYIDFMVYFEIQYALFRCSRRRITHLVLD